MPIKLSSLIAEVSAETETTVKTTRNRRRLAIQMALRSESRLFLPTTEDSDDGRAGASLPVTVLPGYPAPLRNIELPDDFVLGLLLGSNRTAIEHARSGTEGLLKLQAQMAADPRWANLVSATEVQVRATFDWAGALLALLQQSDPMSTLLQVEKDVLGTYQITFNETLPMFGDEYATNQATISLYWGVIGLFAKWMDCNVEDLTIMVLTHELAHAYTQLGADSEGKRWPASEFAKVDVALAEGLAQYYTDRALTRLGAKYAKAHEIFVRLQTYQSAAYRAHEGWSDRYTSEAVRLAILEARRQKVQTVEEFVLRLDDAQKTLETTSKRREPSK